MAKVAKKKTAVKKSKSAKGASRRKASASTARKKTSKQVRSKRKATAGKKASKQSARKKDVDGDMVMQQDQTAADEKPVGRAAEAARPAAEVPEFDLGKQMLAKSRRTTSQRRRGPVARIKLQAETQAASATAKEDSLAQRIARASPQSREKRQIIAEIVQRDIERFRHSSRSTVPTTQ